MLMPFVSTMRWLISSKVWLLSSTRSHCSGGDSPAPRYSLCAIEVIVRLGDGVIASVYGIASKEAFEKEKSYVRWKHVGRVFFLGAGSKLEAVRQRLIPREKGLVNG